MTDREILDNLQKQPSYLLLRRAVSERVAPLAIFVGSGISSPAGFPDWQKLRKSLTLHLQNQFDAEKSLGSRTDERWLIEIKKNENYWDFFEICEAKLGKATYRGLLREILDISYKSIPKSYFDLLKLDPRVFITLNLDRLSGEAITQHYTGRHVIPIYGNELNTRLQALNDERPHLVYLHGHVSAPDTWVLTKSDLQKLRKNDGHKFFLNQIYINNTVIFFGLSADDIAISDSILKLKQNGIETPRIFWITNRNDVTSNTWAKENNVQKILYHTDSNVNHELTVALIVKDISEHQSKDVDKPEPILSIVRKFANENSQDTPRVLAQLESEVVRKTITNLLLDRLNGLEKDELYDAFSKFVNEYRYPIMTRSFYRDAEAGDNIFFGYKLTFPALGSGNFGEVYTAEGADGNHYALKIMHSHIVANREMIGGFRRGVRSMRILTDHKVDGVVPIVEAFEMPPTIIMDHVNGNSLEEIFGQFDNLTWVAKIKIITDVGQIVENCHRIPEMVLHRDIKPSNIMICGLDYKDYTFEKVVVLDFDMSWHKNSSEKDVIFESRDDFGYLAPEQTDPTGRISTRSAKVDSFGLGMTAYALLSGRHPIPGIVYSDSWISEIAKISGRSYVGELKSIPSRLTRAIFDATKPNQMDRLDFDIFVKRMNSIAAATSSAKLDIDLIAEEILFRVSGGMKYTWSDFDEQGKVEYIGGTTFECKVLDRDNTIEIAIRFVDRGSVQYQNRKDIIARTKEYFNDCAKKGIFSYKRANVNHGMLDYIFDVSVSEADSISSLVKIINLPISMLISIS